MAETVVNVTVRVSPVRVTAVVPAFTVRHVLGVAGNVDQTARDLAASAAEDASAALDAASGAAADAATALVTAGNAVTAATAAYNLAGNAQEDATTALGQIAALGSIYQPIGDYLTADDAADIYQPIGSYLTISAGDARYDPIGAAAAVTVTSIGALTQAAGDVRYQPVGTYLTPTTGDARYDAIGAAAAISKSSIGLGSVENTALTTWTGTATLVTLGTVTTGTWHATAIADAYIASAGTWNAKEPPITGGANSTYWRGDKTFQTLNAVAISDSSSTGRTVLTGTAAAARTAIGAAPSAQTTMETSEYWIPNMVIATTTTVAVVLGTIYGFLARQFTNNTYSGIAWENTGTSGGKVGHVCVHAVGADGLPGARIWTGPDQSVGVAAMRIAAFTAGTWHDTSYRDGSNNLTIPLGGAVYVSVETNAASIALRAVGAGACRPLLAPAASFATVNTVVKGTNTYVQDAGPSTWGTATLVAAAVPMIGLLTV